MGDMLHSDDSMSNNVSNEESKGVNEEIDEVKDNDNVEMDRMVNDGTAVSKEAQEPDSGKEKAKKWWNIFVSILILFFFVYDAIWADPYLAYRYYEVTVITVGW